MHLVGMSELKQSVVIFLGFGISSQSNKIVCKGSGCPSTCIDPTVCQKYRENYRGFFYQDICVICSRG